MFLSFLHTFNIFLMAYKSMYKKSCYIDGNNPQVVPVDMLADLCTYICSFTYLTQCVVAYLGFY
jgi:hypothetical protein